MKSVFRRLTALMICVATVLTLMTESLSAIGSIAGAVAGLNPGIATIVNADEVDGRMHVIVRFWHTIDSEHNVISKDDYDKSYVELNVDICHIYASSNDKVDYRVEDRNDLSDIPPTPFETLKDAGIVSFDEKTGIITITAIENSILDADGNSLLKEEFEGFSISAGHGAIIDSEDSASKTLQIKYNDTVHLVKAHVFFKNGGAMVDGKNPDETVFGGEDEYISESAERDTGEVYVYINDAADESHKANDVVVDASGKAIRNKEDLAKNNINLSEVKKVKYYNNTSGLHTDKTATALEDGRTFRLDLESWFVGNNIADVGLVLDASGSMAFTSEGLNKIKVEDPSFPRINLVEAKKSEAEPTGDNIYDFPEDAFLSEEEVEQILKPENTDNSKLSYSDYNYYIFDPRSDTNEYVPIGYYDGEYKIDVSFPQFDHLIGYYPFEESKYKSGSEKDWLLNVVTAYSDEPSYASVYEGKVDSLSNDFTLTGLKNGGEVEGWSSYSYAKMSSDGYNTSASKGGIVLDAVPNSGTFTIAFKTKVDNAKTQDEDGKELMYIGPMAKDPKSIYYRIYRAAGGSDNRLKLDAPNIGKTPSSTNNIYNDTTWKYVTYVFDGKQLHVYVKGSLYHEKEDAIYDVDSPSAFNIVLNAIKDVTDDGINIYLDDIYVFDAALTGLEVKKLYDNYQTKSELFPWASVDKDKVYYTDTAVLDSKGIESQLKGMDMAGWYYVNSQSDWEKLVIVADTSKKYYGLTEAQYKTIEVQSDGTENELTKNTKYYYTVYKDGSTPLPAKSVQSVMDEGFVDGINYYRYDPVNYRPMKFFLDEAGDLCCFYSSGSTNCGWSYVYKKDDGQRIKAENLQHALGMFISRLDEASPDSRISAVRFSTKNITEKDYDKLVMLDWTSDPDISMPMFNFPHGEDVDAGEVPEDGGTLKEHNYILTGGTTTATGLKTFLDNLSDNKGAQEGTKKYLIIFTDGKDTTLNDDLETKNLDKAIEESKALEYADKIREKGYTIFSVMLYGGSIVKGSDDYNMALKFLAALAGEDNWNDDRYSAIDPEDVQSDNPEAKVFDRVYASQSSTGLAQIFSTALVGEIADSLSEYTVQDYIDPRFDLVDAYDQVWHLNHGGEVVIKDSDGAEKERFKLIKESADTAESGTGAVGDSGELEEFTEKEIILSTSAVLEGEGAKAFLRYDIVKDLYYLVWKDATIPGSSEGSKLLPVWNAEITIRAKDDFIGGNAVMSNGNSNYENYVYQEGDIDKNSGTDDAVDAREAEEADEYPSKGFPRTTVNVAVPNLEIANGNQLIFLGENLTSAGVAEKLGERISDYFEKTKDDPSHWYWEYLKRYAKDLVIKEHKGDEPPLTDEQIKEAAEEKFKEIVNDIVAAASAETTYVDFPYRYISDEGDTNQTGGVATGDKHVEDRLGTLRFKWTEVTEAEDYEYAEYPDPSDPIVKDLNKRSSTLEVFYYPITSGSSGLPDEAEKDGNNEDVVNRQTANNGSADRTGSIYGGDESKYSWDPKYKPSAGDEQEYNDKTLHDSGDYVTEIVSGDIVFNMIIPGDVIEYISKHYPDKDLEYTANLVKHNKAADGTETMVTVGTFTATLNAADISAASGETNVPVHFVFNEEESAYSYIKDYGLPIGDYTVEEASHTELPGIDFGKIEVMVPENVSDDVLGKYEPHYESSTGIKKADDYGVTHEESPEPPIITSLDAVLLKALSANVSESTIQIGTSRGTGDYRDSRYGYAKVIATVSTGSLSITKTVEGYDLANEDYTLTIKQVVADDSEPHISGSFSASGVSGITSVEFKDVEGVATATVTLKKDQTITIEGLPAGATFEVTEETDALNYKYITVITPEDGAVITEGDNTQVDVTNTVQTGNLKISKTVSGAGAPKGEKSETFTFDIVLDSGEEVTGTATYKASRISDTSGETEETVTFTNGEATVELKDGESITINGLPAGVKYKVSEQAASGYSVTYKVDTKNVEGTPSVTIGENNTVEVSADNHFNSGKLTVSKTVEGEDADKTKEFNFTVRLTVPEGVELSADGYTCTYYKDGKKTVAGTVKFEQVSESNVYTVVVKLSAGESVTIEGIPAGVTCEVTEAEANKDGYVTEIKKSVSTAITDGGEVRFDFTNTYKTGSIVISKTVAAGEGVDADTLKARQDEDSFTIKIAFKDDEGNYTLLRSYKSDRELQADEANKCYIVSLKHGESVKIEGIPAGYSYEVSESLEEEDEKIYDGEMDNPSGKVEDNVEVTVSVTNTYTPVSTEFTIPVKKIITAEDLPENDYEFTFSISSEDGALLPTPETVTITVAKGKTEGTASFGAIEFTEAGTYTYTVKEEEGNLAGFIYDGAEVEVTVTIADDNGKLTVAGYEVAKGEEYAEKNGDDYPAATFTNIYTPSVEPKSATAEITVNKIFTAEGATSENDLVFSFDIAASGDTQADENCRSVNVTVIQGDETGHGTFEFAFSEAGTYTYTITETGHTGKLPEGSAMTNDTAKEVTFTVTENDDGTLTAEASPKLITFKNSYDPPKPKIDIVKLQEIIGRPGETAVHQGDTVMYTLRVTNNGYAAAKNVIVTDEIPDGLIVKADTVFASGGMLNVNEADGTYGNTASWTIESLAAGETIEYSFLVEIPEVSANRTWVNSATADDVPSNDVELTQRVGSLTVSKTVSGNAASMSDEFDFRLDVYDTANMLIRTELFRLSGGKSITFKGLPVDSRYVVTETNSLDYTCTNANATPDGYAIEGYITEGGVSKTVTFTNVRSVPTGSLTVTKTVAQPGLETPGMPRFDFTLSLQLPVNFGGRSFTYELKDIYGVSLDSGVFTLDVTGIYNFQLGHGESITFSGLPAGTVYTVAEDKQKYEGEYIIEGYNTSGVMQLGESNSVVPANAVYVNTHRTGQLTVSKTAVGNMASPFDIFDFEIRLYDSYENMLSGNTADITGEYGSGDGGDIVYFESGLGYISLEDGGSVTITGLPTGIYYTVTETNSNGYECHLATEQDTVSSAMIPFELDASESPVASGTIEENNPASAAFVNLKQNEVQTGSLTILKSVTGDGDTTVPFNFTLDLYYHNTEGVPMVKADDVNAIGQKTTAEGGSETVRIENGSAVFTLMHGESVIFDNLPADIHYTVREEVPLGYTVSISDTGAIETAGINLFGIMPIDEPVNGVTSGDLGANQSVTVTYTNHIEPKRVPDAINVPLTVEKTLSESGATANNALTFGFNFTLNSAVRIDGTEITDVAKQKHVNVTVGAEKDSGERQTTFTFSEAGIYTYDVAESSAYTGEIPHGSELLTDALPQQIVFDIIEQDGVLVLNSLEPELRLTFENFFAPALEKAHIMLHKKVVDAEGEELTGGTFTFTVTLVNDSAYGEDGFNNGVRAVTVTGGAEVDITVPAGAEVKIEEINLPDGYSDITGVKTVTVGAGETVAVEYINRKDPEPEPEKAHITLHKKVVDADGEELTGGTFTFTVTLVNDSAYGEDGFNNGVRTVTVTGGAEVDITVPTGAEVKIEEINLPDGYSDITGVKTVTVGAGETVAVEYINRKDPEPEPEKAHITLHKKVVDADGEELTGGTFTFTVTLVNDSTYGEDGFNNGVRTVTVTGGAEVDITVPAGAEVKIEETNMPDGYSDITGVKTVTVGAGETATVEYINRKDPEPVAPTGSLRLRKVLTANGTVVSGGREFVFDIELDTDFTGIAGGVEFVNGKATVRLRGGDEVLMSGLPAGARYRITERSTVGYVLDLSRSSGLSGVIADGREAVAVAVNTSAIIPQYPGGPLPQNPSMPEPEPENPPIVEPPTEAAHTEEDNPETGVGFGGIFGLISEVIAAIMLKKKR